MFPHHENEIAQSCCAHHTQYVNTWMHTGMVMVDREKMSKSLGNFFTIRDVLKVYDAETVRYFLMSGHYRSQLNYSDENLNQGRAALERLYTALRGLPVVAAAGGEAYVERFRAAMDDDFNTPEAYSVLFDLAREVNRLKGEGRPRRRHWRGVCASLAACWVCWSRIRKPSSRAMRPMMRWPRSRLSSRRATMLVPPRIGRRPMPHATV